MTDAMTKKRHPEHTVRRISITVNEILRSLHSLRMTGNGHPELDSGSVFFKLQIPDQVRNDGYIKEILRAMPSE